MSEHTMFRDPQKATAPEQTLFDLFYSRLGEKSPSFQHVFIIWPNKALTP